MISYQKLRDYIHHNKLTLSNVCKECGISTNVVTKINKDKSIELKTLEKICLHLNISIQDAVEFIKEE